MNNLVGSQNYSERLRRRRNKVLMTLEHVRKEQRTVDDNQEWIDRAAYQSRLHLLDNLIQWYLKENARIDDALGRIAQGKYGSCVACHGPIEKHRLDAVPETAFCGECQKSREALARA